MNQSEISGKKELSGWMNEMLEKYRKDAYHRDKELIGWCCGNYYFGKT
jgi:hypothetical protein